MDVRQVSHEAGERKGLWLGAVSFSLIAFAANSIFCRLALRQGDIDAPSFTAIRLLGGALFLLVLMQAGRSGRGATYRGGSWRGGLCLFVYAYLFALAYTQLDAGVGALILFGAVQITLFIVGCSQGERLHLRVLLGMAVAFSGLIVLLAPGGNAPPLGSALTMVVSGVAWGIYSALGRHSTHAVDDTAGNFLRSLPWIAAAILATLALQPLRVSPLGALYAGASGVLASGAGYAVWYTVVKRMRAQTAAVMQLSVPVLAAIVGVAVLGEPLTSRLCVASLVVLGGIALALVARRA